MRTIRLRQVHFIIGFSPPSCSDPVLFSSIRFFCTCNPNFSSSRETSCSITCQRSGSSRLWVPRMGCVLTMNLSTSSALTEPCCCALSRAGTVCCACPVAVSIYRLKEYGEPSCCYEASAVQPRSEGSEKYRGGKEERVGYRVRIKFFDSSRLPFEIEIFIFFHLLIESYRKR